MKDQKRETEHGRWAPVEASCASLIPDSRFPSSERGFTLLELLVVMTIIGILAAIAVPALKDSPQRAREAALKEDLFAMRSVIDQYHGDKGTYPADLQTLVTEGYIRKVPLDPMTKSAETWVLAFEEAPSDTGSSSAGPAGGLAFGSGGATSDSGNAGTPGIIDVHSGAPGKAFDGTLYKDW